MIEIKEIKIPTHTFNEHRVCVDCNSIIIYDNNKYVEIKTVKKNDRWFYFVEYFIGNTGYFPACVPRGDGYDNENKAICKAIMQIYNNSEIPNKYKSAFREIYNKYSMNNLL